MNDNPQIQLLIEAVDQASSTIQGVADKLGTLGTSGTDAAEKVGVSMSEIGVSMISAGAIAVAAGGSITGALYEIIKAGSEAQAGQEILGTTVDDTLSIVNDAAKGHGFLASEMANATIQANSAEDALKKLEASTKSSADQIAAAQLKYDTAAAKLDVLKGRMDDVGKSSDAIKEAFTGAEDVGVKLGFTIEDISKSFNILQPIMGSQMAETAVTAAEGLVRASNGTLDLASAVKLLGTAMETGMGRGLAQYGIVIKDGVGGTELLNAVLAQTKNQAENFADTLQGKLAIAWAAVNKAEIDGGLTLTDVLGKIIDVGTKAIIWIDNFIRGHQELVKNLLIGIGVFGVVFTTLGTIMVALGGVIALLGSTGATIAVLVAGGIAAFIAAGALVVANWQPVSKFFVTMWDDIKTAWSGAINFLEGLLDNLIAKVVQVGQTIANSAVGRALGSIGGAVGGVVSSIGNFVSTHLAEGGIVTSPTVALIGEAGPEAVVPLSGLGGGGFQGGGAINISIGSLFGTDSQAARDFATMIVKNLNQQLKLRTY